MGSPPIWWKLLNQIMAIFPDNQILPSSWNILDVFILYVFKLQKFWMLSIVAGPKSYYVSKLILRLKRTNLIFDIKSDVRNFHNDSPHRPTTVYKMCTNFLAWFFFVSLVNKWSCITGVLLKNDGCVVKIGPFIADFSLHA